MEVINLNINFESEKPIYIQIAEEIEDAIMSGAFAEETQVPSTTEISISYKINPATVLKGINILVDNKILYKKRGVGMFVQAGATQQITNKRKEAFFDSYIVNLIAEAGKLEIQKHDIINLIERGFTNERN